MSAFAEPLAQARENVDHAEALLTRDPFGDAERSLAATLLREALAAIERAETWAAEMERVLRELVDAVRIIDVMHREPAAKGLMSAEDYRSYLSGAWLGVDEKVEQARAAGLPILSIDGRYVLTSKWAKEQARAVAAETALAEANQRAANWQGYYADADDKAEDAQDRAEAAEQRANDLADALRDLVALKDGPRDDAYRDLKDGAWRAARAALDRQEQT
jgi:ABC-type Fe3+-hydroxamate transport system substrate-binding protein